MTKRKGELFAELKTQLKSRIESGDNANAKCCNQIVKFADTEDKASGDSKMISLPTLVERRQSVETYKSSQTFAKPMLDCFIDITGGGDDERKNNSDTHFNASNGKKAIQPEGGDKSEWTKKTEEFLLKLQNMECYSRHDEKTTSGVDSETIKNKRKSDSHSRQSDKSVSPPYKKNSDRNFRETSANHDDSMPSSHKTDLKLKPKVSSGMSRDDIWETLQALRKEVTKLEKKRFEMASKSSKQNEKSMATAKQLEYEMKCQMKQLWKAIDDITGDKKETGSTHEGERPISEVQISRNKISFSLKSDKQRNPEKVLTHTSEERHKDVEVVSQREVIPTETRTVNNVVSSGKALNSRSELREKSNSMAHAMSERIKFATSLYLKAENFYDGGNLWCQSCNTLHKNIYEFSQHLHSQDHIKNSNCEDQRTSDDSERLEINPKSAPARGDEFFRPLKAYHCSLCNIFLSDITALRKHFISKDHNIKFKEFLANNDNYEVPYLTQKMAVILRKELSKDVRASVSQSLREERGH